MHGGGTCGKENDGEVKRECAMSKRRVAIELPPFNPTLVKVHSQMATIWNGAKDMVSKNNIARKAKKLAKQLLQEA